MTAFCTYCSAKKDRSRGELPAIQRYQSHRIRSIYSAALSVGVEFLILSGKFGILRPCHPIPYYNHLLKPWEVSDHSKKVAEQLKAIGEKNLVFFTKPISEDTNIKPYLDCIRSAAQKAGVSIKLADLPPANGA